MHIRELQKAAWENAEAKGFHNPPMNLLELCALIGTEVSEAIEEWRNGNEDEVPFEFADVLIRVADACGILGIDLESAVIAKMEKNAGRPYMHGGKRR